MVCLIIPWRRDLHKQVRKGEREIVVCLIIPWRMGNYTDR